MGTCTLRIAKRENAPVEREEVRRLYYITPVANVPSLLAHGILCHRQVALLPHTDISMATVQDIRATKRVPNGLLLHEYTPLFLWARNVMLFKRGLTMLDELCVLAIDPAVLDLEGVVIADHNAAAGIANFAPYPQGLEPIDHDVTFNEYWTIGNDFERDRRRKAMCAEVLVPGAVDARFIRGAFVGSEAAQAAFEALSTNLDVRLWRYLFFN